MRAPASPHRCRRFLLRLSLGGCLVGCLWVRLALLGGGGLALDLGLGFRLRLRLRITGRRLGHSKGAGRSVTGFRQDRHCRSRANWCFFRHLCTLVLELGFCGWGVFVFVRGGGAAGAKGQTGGTTTGIRLTATEAKILPNSVLSCKEGKGKRPRFRGRGL